MAEFNIKKMAMDVAYEVIDGIKYEGKTLRQWIDEIRAWPPHLVTPNDFDGADEYGYLPVWTELKKGVLYCECIQAIALADEYYNKRFRCWTRKPTEEQREAAKWDDSGMIKIDMPMPKDCKSCPFRNESWCVIPGDWRERYYIPDEGRSEYCPLKEV